MSVVIDTSSEIELDEATELSQGECGTEVVEMESAESESVVATQEPEAIESPASAAARISDEDDFRIVIWNAEMRCRGKEAIVEDLKEQLKEAKAGYEQAVLSLRKLANEGRQPMPLFDAPQQAEPQPEPTSELPSGSEAVATAVATDDTWKQKNFIEFIQGAGIEGLGKKKLDALAEVVPTFGCFETLREMASLENVHLSKKLPAGFGEKVTDQIEEAYLSQQWSDSIDDGVEYHDEDDEDEGSQPDSEVELSDL